MANKYNDNFTVDSLSENRDLILVLAGSHFDTKSDKECFILKIFDGSEILSKFVTKEIYHEAYTNGVGYYVSAFDSRGNVKELIFDSSL